MMKSKLIFFRFLFNPLPSSLSIRRGDEKGTCRTKVISIRDEGETFCYKPPEQPIMDVALESFVYRKKGRAPDNRRMGNQRFGFIVRTRVRWPRLGKQRQQHPPPKIGSCVGVSVPQPRLHIFHSESFSLVASRRTTTTTKPILCEKIFIIAKGERDVRGVISCEAPS